MKLLIESNRQQVEILASSKPLGDGGQGKVFHVKNHPNLAAKVYGTGSRAEAEKLRFMMTNRPNVSSGVRGIPTIAWPDHLLIDAQGTPVGFLMQKLSNTIELAYYISPSIRSKNSLRGDLPVLYGLARNTAAAFASAHSRGYVIGDVHEQNVMVHDGACTTLIDADSFQVIDHSVSPPRIFRCTKDRDGYRSPQRLQYGQDMSTYIRTEHDDRFGLAVLIFKLLLDGIHPFQGVAPPGENPSVEDCVRQGWYPHVAGSRITPRPHWITPDCLPMLLKDMFFRSFSNGHTRPDERPTAREWVSAFDNWLQ